VRVPFEEQDLVAGREEFACHKTQYTPTEMAAGQRVSRARVERHVWLRPYTGTLHNPNCSRSRPGV
jgi:hypothetical protein